MSAAIAAAAALAGCSVTVQPKNAASSRPLSSSPKSSAVSSTAPSTSAAASPSSSSSSPASPTTKPTDVDHTVCGNARDVLATLRSKLATDKGSTSRTAQDYKTAGTSLRTQDGQTDNADLHATLKAVGIDYQNASRDVANHESTDTDLGKAADDSKPLSTLCGGGSSSGSSPSTSAGSSN